MKAEKGQKPLPTTEAVTKILSDGISLLCDSSHEIDLRRRKGDMKTEYRLLCSDQNPVDDGLLFGTELGKSVKDLTEAVTSKVTIKQKRPHGSGQDFYFITRLGRDIISRRSFSIREAAQLIGTLPPIQRGPMSLKDDLHYACALSLT